MPDATYRDVRAAVTAVAHAQHKDPTRVVIAEVRAELARLNLVPTGNLAIQLGDAKKDAARAMAHEIASWQQLDLNSPLVSVFVRNSPEMPMHRINPAFIRLLFRLPSHVVVEHGRHVGINQPEMTTLEKLVTVLSVTEKENLLGSSLANGYTISYFLGMDHTMQIALIDRLWDEVTKPQNKVHQFGEMLDFDTPVVGGGGMGGGQQLPSFIVPVRGGANIVSTFEAREPKNAFRHYGVGFRVEGSGQAAQLQRHIERVTNRGMHPQVTLPDLMLENGYAVAGTTVSARAVKPRINKTSLDLWNESGVCVSRSLFGATAFPKREYEGDAILWAVDIKDKEGFDTESYQIGHPNAGNGAWRPGEKCYQHIAPERILGHIIIKKRGDQGGGWHFEIPQEAQWLPAVRGSIGQKDYLENLLAAWRGARVHIGTDYDFVQRPQ